MIRCLLGGLVGGAIGVVAWVLIGYYANFEIGWIAWVIGFLSGFGVRYAGSMDDQEGSAAKGVMAAAIACGAILIAKIIVVAMFVGDVSDEIVNMANRISCTDENAVALMADENVKELTEQGKPVAWPPGVTFETAEKKSDYPAEIWKQAETRWNDLNDQQKDDFKQAKKQQMIDAADAIAGSIGPSLKDSFSPWDLLWFGLALVTAFQIGNGTYGEGS